MADCGDNVSAPIGPREMNWRPDSIASKLSGSRDKIPDARNMALSERFSLIAGTSPISSADPKLKIRSRMTITPVFILILHNVSGHKPVSTTVSPAIGHSWKQLCDDRILGVAACLNDLLFGNQRQVRCTYESTARRRAA